jgi:hypothetical protein
VEPNSSWTAVFANGLRVNDVASATGHLPTVLNCWGLEVGYAPDFSGSKRQDLIRKWGSTLFALYGPTNTDWLNRIRHVHVCNDVNGWTLMRVVRFNHLKSRKPIRNVGFPTGSPMQCWNDTVKHLASSLIRTTSTDQKVVQYEQPG